MGIQNIQNHAMYQSAQETKGIQKQEPVSAPAAPEDTTDNLSLNAIHDEYIHGERPEPTRLYKVTHDQDGNPKIRFDGPMKKSTAGGLSEPAEASTVNTDKVDREIEELKEKREQLKQQISTMKDPRKAEDLKKRLSQIENELRKKDNDAYRSQNAVFS